MRKLTQISAFDNFVSRNYSQEAEIQAESYTASYNQIENTLPMTPYDVLNLAKNIERVRLRMECNTNSLTCYFLTILLLG